MAQVFAQLCLFLPVVWAQIDIQNADGNYIQDNPVYSPTLSVGVMDPSSFSSTVFGCQQNCGDGYYRCFLACDGTSHPKLPTKAYFEESTNKQIWSSYLLNLLSFGYYGNQKKRDKTDEVNYDSRYIGDKQGLSSDRCLKNCTKLFRVCYRHCACRVGDDVKLCMSELIKSRRKQKHIESDSGFTAGFKFINSKDKDSSNPTEYKFNWRTLS